MFRDGPLEQIAMDELLKQALYSVGITYLTIRVGRFIVSLVSSAIQRLAQTETEHSYPDRR